MPGHSAGIGLPFDPDRGRQLLAEAGYPGGVGFPDVDFWTDEDHGTTYRYLESQWRDNLGLEIEAREADLEGFLILLESAPPQLFVYTWFADYPDPDNYLRVCRAIHWTRCQDGELLGLIEGAAQVADQGERIKLYSRADRVLTEQAILFPFAYLRTHLLVKPWIRHLPTSAIKWWYWQDVVIESH
jgi:oligopeptide transport system substrate-binding protein